MLKRKVSSSASTHPCAAHNQSSPSLEVKKRARRRRLFPPAVAGLCVGAYLLLPLRTGPVVAAES